MKKTLSLLFFFILLATACTKKNEPDRSTASPVVTTFAGSGAWGFLVNGAGTSATFARPEGIAVDAAGNVYVADTYLHIICKISPLGMVTTIAGSGLQGSANGTGTSASFRFPQGVTVDAAGNVYVADTNNQLIRKISVGGVVNTVITQAIGIAAFSALTFFYPHGVAADAAGNVYVADTDNNTIDKITPEGIVTTFAGNYYTTGSANGTSTSASFNSPGGVAIDAAGNVYVADSGNNLIRKITPDGVVTTLAGSGLQGSANGTGTSASFYDPTSVAVNASGIVYVSDSGNNLIRKISPDGVVTTLAGTGLPGSANGTGASASFNYPQGIAVDAAGNVYVADAANNLIRKITISN